MRTVRGTIAVGALGALGLALSACSSASGPAASASRLTTSTSTAPATTTTVAPTTTTSAPAVGGALPSGQPLAGKVVGIDPGHNGMNYTDPSFLNQQIFNGRTREDCDTTGTQTAGGYSEAQFNFNVAKFLTSDLQSEGAQVVLTRSSNSGVGPCVDQRAQIINSAHADVAVDIHADGGPVSGRGFTILEPVADGPNNAVITSSGTFGDDLRSSFLSTAGMPLSTYDGSEGIAYRDDLGGLNLTTVPKVLIECGNMQNPTDVALLVTTTFQQRAALAMALAITNFLG
jgi:N-acetylmuramoyl-L-alanine amidase